MWLSRMEAVTDVPRRGGSHVKMSAAHLGGLLQQGEAQPTGLRRCGLLLQRFASTRFSVAASMPRPSSRTRRTSQSYLRLSRMLICTCLALRRANSWRCPGCAVTALQTYFFRSTLHKCGTLSAVSLP